VYRKISDYGIIGNCRTVALIGNDGSIDWLCLPFLDSPSLFGALLDHRQGGRFAITPTAAYDSSTSYLPGTNILVTCFRTRGGLIRLTDFMPVAEKGEHHPQPGVTEIYRCLEGVAGEMELLIRFEPRFDYGRAATLLSRRNGALLAASCGEEVFLVAEELDFQVEGASATAFLRLIAGEKIWLRCCHGIPAQPSLDRSRAEMALRATERYWRNWLQRSETGLDLDPGPFGEMINRSALVLKLLEFAPTGAIAAAATTSLPEAVGGVRNWDYRFSWVRDSALTVQAFFNIGHLAEMENYLRWLEGIIREHGADLQVLYGLHGEQELAEQELTHLEGYKGSVPVRIGNQAYMQKQLDIYGEIMDAALRLSNYVGKIDASLWPFFQRICNRVVERWREKDSGIWEVRGGPYHFVHSKVMCWVALDRGLTIARRYGFPADFAGWEKNRAAIRAEILARGWSPVRQAFVQHYETEALDASVLLLPFYDFLAYADPRMLATVEAIQCELTADGFICRYQGGDGLPGGEGAFLVCSFWLVDNLIGQKRFEEALTMLLRLEKAANHLGLFAEEYDPFWREQLGNFPQAFSHIGYINSAVALCRAMASQERQPRPRTMAEKLEQRLLVTRSFILNKGKPPDEEAPRDIIADLKQHMNVLRGAFFRTAVGRVAYEEMAGSRVYHQYVRCSRRLQELDPAVFIRREEQLAFWINIYNVLVIHGVIALGVRDSVREVPWFFRRARYLIGGMDLCADDIEHGILRANHRRPHSPFRPFGRNDPRRRLVIEPMDPRIHFALVCASSSCPPIEIYEADSLDHDLTVSGQTFLNAGGVRIDRARRRVFLPQVFNWYGEDFGRSMEEKLRFVAPYLYVEEDRRFLEEESHRLQVGYLPYDWRLNRL
jgi:GH15 family glucan-1,4-alpha-glucosidase